MTPYELMIHLEAHTEKEEVRMQEEITLVWLGEYYHRQKRLPRIESELKKLMGSNNEPMSDDEMLEMVKALNAQFGGTFEGRG